MSERGPIVVWEDGGRLGWEHGLGWIVERRLGNGVVHILAACSSEETARLLERALAVDPQPVPPVERTASETLIVGCERPQPHTHIPASVKCIPPEPAEASTKVREPEPPFIHDHAYMDPDHVYKGGERADSCMHETENAYAIRVCGMPRAAHEKE